MAGDADSIYYDDADSIYDMDLLRHDAMRCRACPAESGNVPRWYRSRGARPALSATGHLRRGGQAERRG
jgi:hypothetical protein